MKNLLSFKIGKEKIEIWQVFIFSFLLLMFFVCLFLGIGIISTANNNVNVNMEVPEEELGLITNFDNLSEKYSEEELIKYNKTYNKDISDNYGLLKLDNFEIDLYGNINSSIYRINLNKNHYFLFNNINKNISELNEFFIVDTELKFHKILYQTNTIVKDYSNDSNYEKFEINDFYFFYNKNSDYFYAYKYINGDSINDYYFILCGEKIGFKYKNIEKLFKFLESNISITQDKKYTSTGLVLNNKYKNININNKYNLDLYSNVYINSINNGLRSNSNSIVVTNKTTNDTYSIKEIFKGIDETTKNTKRFGYLKYMYDDMSIYLKYNLVDYPEFNYSEGGINGVLIESGNCTILIQFEKVFEFASQEELDKILEDTIGSILNR